MNRGIDALLSYQLQFNQLENFLLSRNKLMQNSNVCRRGIFYSFV